MMHYFVLKFQEPMSKLKLNMYFPIKECLDDCPWEKKHIEIVQFFKRWKIAFNFVFSHIEPTYVCKHCTLSTLPNSVKKISGILLGWDSNPWPLPFRAVSYQLDHRDCPVARGSSNPIFIMLSYLLWSQLIFHSQDSLEYYTSYNAS